MSGGGSQTTETETKIPEWQEDLVREAAQRAKNKGDQPNMPYRGMVQAVNPQQQAITANTGAMAKAFGLDFNENPMAGRAPPEQNSMGMLGYSTGGLFDDEMDRMGQKYPGLLDYIKSLSIDPVTGAAGSRTYAAGNEDDDDDDKRKGPRAVGNGNEYYEVDNNTVIDRNGRFIRRADDEDRDLPHPPPSAYRWDQG